MVIRTPGSGSKFISVDKDEKGNSQSLSTMQIRSFSVIYKQFGTYQGKGYGAVLLKCVFYIPYMGIS